MVIGLFDGHRMVAHDWKVQLSPWVLTGAFTMGIVLLVCLRTQPRFIALLRVATGHQAGPGASSGISDRVTVTEQE